MRHHFFPPHLRRRIKEGNSAIVSPSQEENQRGGFRSSLPLSGGDTEGVSTGGNLTPALS